MFDGQGWYYWCLMEGVGVGELVLNKNTGVS